MIPFILVHGNGRTLKVQADGTVGEHTLRRAFLLENDVPIGLFRNEIALQCHSNDNESVFELENEWNGAEFELKWNEARRSRPIKPTPADFEEERIHKVINEWEDRVFMINGEKGQGSCVLISGQQIITVAHLSFKLHENYNIRGTNNRCFSVKCEFISKKNDFAILKSTELPEVETRTDQLNRGKKYVTMGYPKGSASSKPSVAVGFIEGMMDDNVQLVGTAGSKKGFFGAPVFDCFGRLSGILLGSKSGLNIYSTVREFLESSAEQHCTRILGISIIMNCYKHPGHSDNES